MNGMKTLMLLSALSALFMGLGYMFGGPGGAAIALAVAAGLNLFTFWNADRIVQACNVLRGDFLVGKRACACPHSTLTASPAPPRRAEMSGRAHS